MIAEDRIARGDAHDPAGDARHREADRLQRPAEQAVLLVAPAAAPPPDQLGEDLGEVAGGRPAELDIEILERDGRDMRAHDRREAVVRRRDRAGMADALEIGGEIHRAGIQ
jgi:hypothetical protein